MRDRSTKASILIAGGGFAALEAALALRALIPARSSVTLLSPQPRLHYRPAASLEPFFKDGRYRSYDLQAIAAQIGVSFKQDRLESVAAGARYIRTVGGGRLEYDALILATGARAVTGIPGALTIRDQRDQAVVRRVFEELDRGAVRRVVFAAPGGAAWTLPLYELALAAARRAERQASEVEVSVVTPEAAPLAVFGAASSRAVSELLTRHGVRFLGGVQPAEVLRDGSLALAFDGRVQADRVVAVPELRGRRITGVPASWLGFVPVDASGAVEGLDDVYAAGDMTTFPVKQGGLATQQADRIVHRIAALLGGTVHEPREPNVLQARLFGGERPLMLRTELDWRGRPTAASAQHTDWAASADSSIKVFGRYLTPYLEAAAPAAA